MQCITQRSNSEDFQAVNCLYMILPVETVLTIYVKVLCNELTGCNVVTVRAFIQRLFDKYFDIDETQVTDNQAKMS